MKEGKNFQKVVELIKKSDLPNSDKEFWYQEIKKVPDEYLVLFLAFLQTMPEKLTWLTNLHKRKILALKEENETEWNALLKKEKEAIKEILTEEEKNA